jgi:cytoskeletal protein RodZ
MRTVGEILRKARIEKHLSFEDVEKSLKIRKKFLMALEENAWQKMPSLPYIKGFLRTYSNYLGLKSEEIVAIFRRQFQENDIPSVLPDGLSPPAPDPPLRLAPHMIAALFLAFGILLFFAYLGIQYHSAVNPPPVTISEPQEGAIVTTNDVKIEGKTDSDATLTINGQKVGLTDSGQFATTITFSPGVTTITIDATSKYGKKRTITRTIQVQPGL